MDDFSRILFLWLHILGVAIFVGPQVFLAYGWVPTSRQITDHATRLMAMRSLTRKFGYLGGAGLVLILISGTYLISTWRDYYAIPDEESFTAVRYGVIFIVKMTVLLVMLVVVGFHTFVTGPRLMDQLEASGSEDDPRTRSLRMQSRILSILGLLLALALMVMGVSMNVAEYSIQDA